MRTNKLKLPRRYTYIYLPELFDSSLNDREKWIVHLNEW